MLSPKTCDEWRGDLSLFAGFFNPTPACEIKQATWVQCARVIAPETGPLLASVKERAIYFCTCFFKEAAYVGKTRTRAMRAGRSILGQQRSSQHCTASALLCYDIDGMSADRWSALQERLSSMNAAYLLFSTWSYGLPEKPGYRARLVLPMDVALDPQVFNSAWHGGAAFLFGDMPPDRSSSRMYQQQGVWATAPDRAHLAFRIFRHGFVLSANAAVAAGERLTGLQDRATTARVEEIRTRIVVGSPHVTYKRLQQAIAWLDAEDTPAWMANVTALKAAAAIVGEDHAYKLVVDYSNRGSEAAKANNDDSRYNPEAFFMGVTPTMPADVGVATLCQRARAAALRTLEAERGRTALSPRGREAASYLAAHHRSLFDQLHGKRGQEASLVRR